ncbi:MAG: DUF4159 domain-containing protein [Bacteroidota bacterium]
MLRLLPWLLVATFLVPAGAAQDYDFQIARVKYGGGGDWYSDEQSLPELLRYVRANTLLNVAPREEVVELTSNKLFTYPYLYLTGHGNVRLTDDEADRLRRYLEGGGFLHIDDNYGLDEHIRREMERVFPGRSFIEIPFNHPVYQAHYTFPDGLPKIHEHDGKPAQGFGLFDDRGRLMVFYSYESDLGDGWEPNTVHNNSADRREAALRMGTNLLVYAMTRPEPDA